MKKAAFSLGSLNKPITISLWTSPSLVIRSLVWFLVVLCLVSENARSNALWQRGVWRIRK